MQYSPLQKARYQYEPKLPEILRRGVTAVKPVFGEPAVPASDQEALKSLFPHTYGMKKVVFSGGKLETVTKKINVGVVLSGGQAP
nr:diphosphate--fructose-6-phosphate 1-phosphotransferase [Spirochaetales bacterium]